MTVTSETDPSIRDIIKARVQASSDSGFPKRTYWRSRAFLDKVDFSDFMDIVLYRISLEPELEKVATIRTHDFWGLIEATWREWDERLEKAWGYTTYEYPSHSGKKHKYSRFLELGSAWHGGSGPMGETMGTDERYALLRPGFTKHEFLLQFFSFPEALRDEGGSGNWPHYVLNTIERQTFPTFRRKRHFKKLDIILDFAEDVYQKLREEASKRN